MITKVEWIGDGLHVCMKDLVTYDELNDLRDKIWGDEQFEYLKYGIYDILDVRRIEVSSKEIIEIAHLDKSSSRWNKSMKLAFVLNKNILENTMQAYIDQMKGINWEIKTFKDYNEALEWCKK